MTELKTPSDLTKAIEHLVNLSELQSKQIRDSEARQCEALWFTQPKFVYSAIVSLLISFYTVGHFIADVQAQTTAVKIIAQENSRDLESIASKSYVENKLYTQQLKVEAVSTAVNTVSAYVDKAEIRNDKHFDKIEKRFDKVDNYFKELRSLILEQARVN